MSPTTPDRNELAQVKATVESELEQLQRLAAQTRETLARLQQDVLAAEAHLGSVEAMQLVEANELLVVAALRAQTDAEQAALALNEVSRAAELDTLTELPNRVLLLDRLAQAIAIAKRRHSRLALLFLDLNNFKQINDTLGHAVGDEVLKVAARCLASSVRAADTVSRHGGDEFLILLADVSHASDAVVVANKVIAALGSPSRVGEHVLRLTASIGISIFPDDGDDASTLIDRADAAMYRAKRQGLGRYACYGEARPPEHNQEPPARPSLPQPMAHAEAASIEHERRNAQLQRRDVDMAAVIELAVNAWRPAMDMRMQRFSVQLPSRALPVHGDAAGLEQIVGNLLDNASRYTPNRGDIALSVEVVDEKLVMTVSDSGIGIAAEALPHAFEPFMRDTHAVGFGGAGLGIGLTVVRALVQAHGGQVAASSAGSGLGSQFVVTLPLAGAPVVQPG